MWLLSGPFEPAQPDDGTATVTKVLKTNKLYGVGRHKDSALCINNKKVSRKNGEFVVGAHTVDDVSNAASVPTMTFRNNKTAAMKVSRGSDSFIVNPDSTYELQSGDVIRLASNVNATVTWNPTVCFFSSESHSPKVDPAACAAIGVKLVSKHTGDVTHHITATIAAPLHPSMLLSLLTPAWLVNGDWLPELLQRAQHSDTHEGTFDAPPERSYRPAIDDTFAEHHPAARDVSWEPNEMRKGLFNGIRFIFAVIGSGIGSATKAISEIVSRGGADRQLVNVERDAEEQAKGAGGTWATILKKRKTVFKEGMGSGLVLVGDHESMVAKGVPEAMQQAWQVMVAKAKSVNMRIIHPSLITDSILKANVSLLDCVTDEGSRAEAASGLSDATSLPEFIPSTHPEEPSQPPSSTAGRSAAPGSRTDGEAPQPSRPPPDPIPGPSRRLTRRATSQTPTPAPEPVSRASMEVEEEASSVPKKPLKRRARTGVLVNELLGLDDTTVLAESQLSQELSVPKADAVLPTPGRSGRLKRRAGTAANTQPFPEDLSTREDGEDQPLKKFKALFEESGQGRTSSQYDGETGSGDENYGAGATQMPVVVEEEEEEESFQRETQTRKRKSDAIEEEESRKSGDVEMRDASDAPTAKRRAVEAVNAVERSQMRESGKPHSKGVVDPGVRTAPASKGGAKSTSTKSGDAPGQPDTDPAFLRAIASNKRGKRLEDDFDRDFNKLRIAKTVIDDAAAGVSDGVHWEREWDGLGDFEKDVGVRGNFMQIVELKVWKDVQNTHPGQDVRRESGLGARLDWDGRPDYKKFKRKVGYAPKQAVKLVLSDQRGDSEREAPHFDYGSKRDGHGSDDESQSQGESHSYPFFTQGSSYKSRPRSQGKSKLKAKAIFEESDEEVEEGVGGFGAGAGRRRPAGRVKIKNEPRSGGKKPALFLTDSEQEDVPPAVGPNLDATLDDANSTLRSSSKETMQTQMETQVETGKGKTRGTKRKIMLEEEDSDQGLTFGGFSRRAKKR